MARRPDASLQGDLQGSGAHDHLCHRVCPEGGRRGPPRTDGPPRGHGEGVPGAPRPGPQGDRENRRSRDVPSERSLLRLPALRGQDRQRDLVRADSEKGFGRGHTGERLRITASDGTISHAELDFEGGRIFLATPTPDYQSPKHHGKRCAAAKRWSAVPWVIDGLSVQVDSVDAHFARAKGAGATILSEPQDNPYGRLYREDEL